MDETLTLMLTFESFFNAFGCSRYMGKPSELSLVFGTLNCYIYRIEST